MQLRHTESNARFCSCWLNPVYTGARARDSYIRCRVISCSSGRASTLSFLLTPWELGELECKQTSKGNLIEELQ